MENEDKRIAAYIRDILSGRPIADIPRGLVVKVHNAFDGNKNKFNISKSQYDKIMHEFKNVEKRFGLNKKDVQNIQTSKNDTSFFIISNEIDDNFIYEEDDIENTVDELIHGGSFENIQTESIDSIIDYCKRKIDQFVNNGEFNEASAHQNILDEVIQLSYERIYFSSILSKKESISNQVEYLNLKIKEENERSEREIQKINQETSYLIKNEDDEWAKSKFEFDFETNQGPTPKFLKLSSKLLNLKQVEKSLIKGKRFSEASKIHEISSKLEEKELNEQYKIFINERENKKEQLNIFHQTKIQNILSSANRKKEVIEQKRQMKISSYKNAIRNILIKEQEINDLINEEKKIQNEEANSISKKNINISRTKRKKSATMKPKKKPKIIKKVHFSEDILQ